MQLLFHKVKVKPGKPILAGRYKDCVVIGLPGNPVSAFTGFAVFVEPTLRKMMGYRSWMNVELRVALAEPLRCKPGRVTYHLCRIEVTEGRLAARPVSSSGSGDVLAIALADGFMITDETIGELPRGAAFARRPLRVFDHRSRRDCIPSDSDELGPGSCPGRVSRGGRRGSRIGPIRRFRRGAR
jgi:molybdopterin biosynthesis enzyme